MSNLMKSAQFDLKSVQREVTKAYISYTYVSVFRRYCMHHPAAHKLRHVLANEGEDEYNFEKLAGVSKLVNSTVRTTREHREFR